ncbi:MAG: enoyl-CoA hydratase/isomerase family protein [Bradyrhizobium sp.]|jgi:2-(1,2-epoxy-1,2-dihydrophenyl)acetyl-CoA isomerase|uniref:enoyl-CoA hydratase-related protein n=1 Tax=Bradyrhizobium sp. TaxID=376 RepID=UPI0009B8EDF8|nr:enoyl-CoA hydratase-related protein [Bradyrhizobium sp.]MBJ7408452.1 enoyl-CoA hydratase/isomerase family protein [Bradyrhizobium sp.]
MNLTTPTRSFLCDIVDGLARIVFNRPDRGNPVNRVLPRIQPCDGRTEECEDVRAVLISARGKMFSVGGDIAAFERQSDSLPSLVKHWTEDLRTVIVRMKQMRAPVVVAVHSHVAGGSVSLAAAADIVVMAKSARITAAFTKIGFSPDTAQT